MASGTITEKWFFVLGIEYKKKRMMKNPYMI